MKDGKKLSLELFSFFVPYPIILVGRYKIIWHQMGGSVGFEGDF